METGTNMGAERELEAIRKAEMEVEMEVARKAEMVAIRKVEREAEMEAVGINEQAALRAVQSLPGLVKEGPGQARLSSGSEGYALREAGGPIARREGGLFGPYAADLVAGQWLTLPRAECPALQFSGRRPFTISAGLRRSARDIKHCQAIAGMWNETAGTFRRAGQLLRRLAGRAGDL